MRRVQPGFINQSINQFFLFDLFGTHHVHRITHESLIMTYFQCGPLMTCGVLEWVGGGVHDSYSGGGWVSVDRRLFRRFGVWWLWSCRVWSTAELGAMSSRMLLDIIVCEHSHLFLTFRDHGISTSLWAILYIIFQYCLFSVMSAVSSYLVMSSMLLSVHLSLGRPLLLFPVTSMSITFLDRLSDSLLLTCPYQCNRFCLRNVDIWHTLASSCVIWFLTWSFLVSPLIHRSILISATCNIMFSSFFLTAQHSAPLSLLA